MSSMPKSKEVYFIYLVYRNSKGLDDIKFDKTTKKEAKRLKKLYSSKRCFTMGPPSANIEYNVVNSETDWPKTLSDVEHGKYTQGSYVKIKPE